MIVQGRARDQVYSVLWCTQGTLACRQTISVNGPGAGISELAVQLQSLEQGIPFYQMDADVCIHCTFPVIGFFLEVHLQNIRGRHI